MLTDYDCIAAPSLARSFKPDQLMRPALTIEWARNEAQVRAAQCLRHAVFVTELGAHPAVCAHPTSPRHECDHFDPFCDHLLIRAAPTFEHPEGILVGTCRVLRPEQAKLAGGLYSDTEFDLHALAPLRASALEMGRSCVHPDWRSGSVIMTMWRALGQFMQRNGLDTLFGCASIWLGDGGIHASHVWQHLRIDHLAAPQWLVRPRLALPDAAMEFGGGVHPPDIPPLIKGYLRCGAKVLGPPARDPAFNTADLPMMLRLDDLAPRYRQHFLSA